GLEPEPAGLKIDMVTLAREQLGLDAPSRDVRSEDRRLQLAWEPSEHRLEGRPLEEALAHIVLVEHVDHWTVAAKALGHETVHPLQGRELAVDRRVGRAFNLAVDDVLRDHVAADVTRAATGEHRCEMRNGILDALEGPTTVRRVIVDEVGGDL